MKKVKFIKNFTNSNKTTFKKGTVRNMTSKMAAFLQKNGFATSASKDDKEDEDAENRETK